MGRDEWGEGPVAASVSCRYRTLCENSDNWGRVNTLKKCMHYFSWECLCLANQYLTVLSVHTVYSYAKAFDRRQCLDMQRWTEIKRKPDKYWQGRLHTANLKGWGQHLVTTSIQEMRNCMWPNEWSLNMRMWNGCAFDVGNIIWLFLIQWLINPCTNSCNLIAWSYSW